MTIDKNYINNLCLNMPTHSGVYRMIDINNVIIYIGKAKNLKKRVSSYFSNGAKDTKTLLMVSKIADIKITITPSDTEAYLLERALIKEWRPQYNIIFKDDKSYPYLVLSNHKHPRLYSYRGKIQKNGTYFGPYPCMSSARNALATLQKLFPIRQCLDSYYKLRKRPCLQYQIKRCLGPCVYKESDNLYQEQVDLLKLFMAGKLAIVLENASIKMQEASNNQDYKMAAYYRDQLITLQKLQQKQILEQNNMRNFDAIGIFLEGDKASISLLEILNGKIVSDNHWIISVKISQNHEDVLSAFLSHHYFTKDRNIWPKQVILPKLDLSLLQEQLNAISTYAKIKIEWINNLIGDNKIWQNLAATNAEQKFNMAYTNEANYRLRLNTLCKWLNIYDVKRIECFDISHFQGESTVASCVVYDAGGVNKKYFRRYNIKNITPGDDYGAIRQAVDRRIKSGIQANNLPDILIIDGGKGQIKQAREILESYKVEDKITLLSLSKGVARISGKEDIHIAYHEKIYNLPENDLGFLLLRQIRDSAHDWAIKGQRHQTRKAKSTSIVEDIEGVGPKRRQALLLHFGGWQELSKASVTEIEKVAGISKNIAQKIWNTLH